MCVCVRACAGVGNCISVGVHAYVLGEKGEMLCGLTQEHLYLQEFLSRP